jgi:hypothetical protein
MATAVSDESPSSTRNRSTDRLIAGRRRSVRGDTFAAADKHFHKATHVSAFRNAHAARRLFEVRRQNVGAFGCIADVLNGFRSVDRPSLDAGWPPSGIPVLKGTRMHRLLPILSLLVLAGSICVAPALSAQSAAPRALQFRSDHARDRRVMDFAPQPAPERCQRRTRAVVGQILAGTAGAWVGGLAAFARFDDPYGPGRRVKGDAGYTPDANTAYAVGSFVGAVAGVELAARFRCGSALRSMLGAAAPSALLLLGRDEPYLFVLGVLFVAPVQAAGATLARRAQ